MFSYCFNAPVVLADISGHRPVLITEASNAPSMPRSLPKTGDPNSSQTLYNPDGTPKQKRWYDGEGNAERDRDYNHEGDAQFPHDHEWKDGKRGKEHLPPSPDYKCVGNLLVGTGMIIASVAGMVYIVGNDITGAGVADDALVVPLGEAIRQAIIMIFK